MEKCVDFVFRMNKKKQIYTGNLSENQCEIAHKGDNFNKMTLLFFLLV
jgi:hypothetical protein